MAFRLRFWLFWSFAQVTLFVSGGLTELLSKCRSTSDCDVDNSFCHSGICICKPYFAQYQSSACLPARLLDQECSIGEQCGLKVAKSTCIGGRCKCQEGYLQFRRHTCLPAARPGDICLNNEHCKLWSKNSYCLFLIPNLIGRCSCNMQTKLHSSSCLDEEDDVEFDVDPTTESAGEYSAVTKPHPKENVSDHEESAPMQGNEYVAKVQDPSAADPFYDQRKHHSEKPSGNEISDSAEEANANNAGGPVTETVDETTLQDENGTTGFPVEQYEDGTGATTVGAAFYSESPEVSGTSDGLPNLKPWGMKKSISLGLPCVTDEQCQSADPESVCINNRCDCAVHFNRTQLCKREEAACPSDTFQCYSTGICLSWFFVCDGRKHCPDGSDEDCSGPYCPRHSYQCARSRMCISRSAVCDGTKNCPDGEDELLCGTNEGQCPRHSFRCRNGQCLPEFEFCNAIQSCSDGSDELEEVCGPRFLEGDVLRPANCPFRCANGRCRSTAILCTGKDGCGDNSDEEHCTVCRASGAVCTIHNSNGKKGATLLRAKTSDGVGLHYSNSLSREVRLGEDSVPCCPKDA